MPTSGNDLTVAEKKKKRLTYPFRTKMEKR